MLTSKWLSRCAPLVLLTFCITCNSSQSAKKPALAASSANQASPGQQVAAQPPISQPAALQKPVQTQEQQNITYAKNPGRFVKQQASEPLFNITDPKTAQEHFNVAVNNDHHNQLDQAIAEYQKALELKPDWALAHFRMAQDYEKQGDTDEAIQHWTLATKYDPQFYSAYDLLSGAYERQGKLKKAIEAYSALLKYPPAQMPVHYQVGMWYAELGDVPQAREHLEAYRELALNSKSVEIQSDRFQKATKELQKLKQ
jgi:tetratricopeptide (TPR) repeat protein